MNLVLEEIGLHCAALTLNEVVGIDPFISNVSMVTKHLSLLN